MNQNKEKNYIIQEVVIIYTELSALILGLTGISVSQSNFPYILRLPSGDFRVFE